MEPQRRVTRQRECLQLPGESAALAAAARSRSQMQSACLRVEMSGRARCRSVEREVQAAQRAAMELELAQMRGYDGGPLRGGIEVDSGIEPGKRHALIEDVRSAGGCVDVRRRERSANCARCLQAATAACGQQTEVLSRHAKSQIGRAVDAAVERQSRAAEAHTHLLERPGVTSVRNAAAAAGCDAAQPPAEPIDLHTERIARLEAAPSHLEPKIEAAGQIRPDLPRIDSRRVAADGPALHGRPDHLSVHIRVPMVEIDLRAAQRDAGAIQLARDVRGHRGEGCDLSQSLGVELVGADARELEASRAAAKRYVAPCERPAKIAPTALQVETRAARHDSDRARGDRPRPRALVDDVDSTRGEHLSGKAAVEPYIERARLQSSRVERAACAECPPIAIQGQLAADEAERAGEAPGAQVEILYECFTL